MIAMVKCRTELSMLQLDSFARINDRALIKFIESVVCERMLHKTYYVSIRQVGKDRSNNTEGM